MFEYETKKWNPGSKSNWKEIDKQISTFYPYLKREVEGTRGFYQFIQYPVAVVSLDSSDQLKQSLHNDIDIMYFHFR